jgi:AcrR family transcriptional regulator
MSTRSNASPIVAKRGPKLTPGVAPSSKKPVTMGAENKSGQRLGEKGKRTRLRIIAATRSLIEASRGAVPTSAAIAREVNLTAPTFNLYFNDVAEAVLAVIQTMKDELAPAIALLEVEWPEGETYERAQTFVKAYFSYWKSHAALLRTRNRLADDGDERFTELRYESIRSLVAALAAKMAVPKANSSVSGTREQVAIVFVVALERIATVNVLEAYPKHLRGRSDMVDVLASMMVHAMREA